MSRRQSRALAVALASALTLGGAGAAWAAPVSPETAPSYGTSASKDHHKKDKNRSKKHKSKKHRSNKHNSGTTFTDLGNKPGVFNIEKETEKNRNFRTAAWTAKDLQVTLMSIPVGGDVGLEMHDDTSQFLRIESGSARVMMGDENKLGFVRDAGADDVILVPAGTWHNIVNTGDTPLKLYSLYGPAHHPEGTVHATQADDPHSGDPVPSPKIGKVGPRENFSVDNGAVPAVFNIAEATRTNTNFRTAAWTSPLLQLTLMDIPVSGAVGLEMHDDVDQFLRVESGRAKVYFGTSQSNLRFSHVAKAGDAILVPAGTWHNIVNDTPDGPLELYSLYGPQQHPQGTVHVTQADDQH